MTIHLVDCDPDVAGALQVAFASYPEVQVAEGDILARARVCVVSPANSYGFMDGGIDAQYTAFFGLRPQTELQDHISRRREGELPVGSSIVVRTGHQGIPYMICAPTMITPGPVPKQNAFYAMAAVLNAIARHREVLIDIFCPGLCTGTGRVSPADAADEMASAYAKSWLRAAGAGRQYAPAALIGRFWAAPQGHR
jgi:O-acetyl-ADP-ribose deacetylase (regulator of RNase III)